MEVKSGDGFEPSTVCRQYKMKAGNQVSINLDHPV